MTRLITYCPDDRTAEVLTRICEALGCQRTCTGDESDPEAVVRVKAERERPITDLHLSVRAANCLDHRYTWPGHVAFPPLVTVGDLCDKTESDLLRIKNFGRVCLNEVKDELARIGLGLREVGR